MSPEISSSEHDLNYNELAIYNKTVEILGQMLFEPEKDWKNNRKLRFIEISGYDQWIQDLYIRDDEEEKITIFMTFLSLGANNCCSVEITETEEINRIIELKNQINS